MKRISLYLLGGGINYFLKLSITFLFTEILLLKYYYSYVVSLVTVIMFSFYYNFYITFQNKDKKLRKFIKYIVFLFIINALDYLLVIGITGLLKIPYLVSITAITLILFIVKYIIFKNSIFTQKENKNIAGNFCDKENSKNPLIRYVHNQFKKDVLSMVKKVNPKKIIDIGCGEGNITRHIAKNIGGIKIIGYDIEEKAISKAKKLSKNITFKVGDIYKINEKDNSCDLVIANEVLEHIEEPKKALNELKRVTNKYCIISVPNEPIWSIANIVRLKYLSDLGNTLGHIQNWTKSGFKKLLKKEFKVLKLKTSSGLWNIALCRKHLK